MEKISDAHSIVQLILVRRFRSTFCKDHLPEMPLQNIPQWRFTPKIISVNAIKKNYGLECEMSFLG